MIGVNFASFRFYSICYCTSHSFNKVDIINYRFGIPCLPREHGYILISEECICDIKVTEEA